MSEGRLVKIVEAFGPDSDEARCEAINFCRDVGVDPYFRRPVYAGLRGSVADDPPTIRQDVASAPKWRCFGVSRRLIERFRPRFNLVFNKRAG